MLFTGYIQDGSNYQAESERTMPMFGIGNFGNNLSGFVGICGAKCSKLRANLVPNMEKKIHTLGKTLGSIDERTEDKCKCPAGVKRMPMRLFSGIYTNLNYYG